MTRALLVDRFKLATHMENREQQMYDLVFARGDHRLGPNIKPSEPGCEAHIAAERAAMEAARAEGRPPPPRQMPDRNGSVPACWGWIMGISAEGDITLQSLAITIQLATLRPVTNKTGLTGSYRIKLTFDMGVPTRTRRGPESGRSPTIFVAARPARACRAGEDRRAGRHRSPRTADGELMERRAMIVSSRADASVDTPSSASSCRGTPREQLAKRARAVLASCDGKMHVHPQGDHRAGRHQPRVSDANAERGVCVVT
jgi:hypothetical protein